MVIYQTKESNDDVVDPEHRDDDFEDVDQEVVWLKPVYLPVSSLTDDSNSETPTDHIWWS